MRHPTPPHSAIGIYPGERHLARAFPASARRGKPGPDHGGGQMSGDVAQPTIFLSYAHGDHAQAQRLAAALQRGGYTVWWDALIEGGTRYAASIDEALETADAVVVLWSRNSVNSDWVRDEAAQGRERHRLVPLSLDGTHPPLGFRQIQMIDISGWKGRSNAAAVGGGAAGIAAAMGQAVPPRPAEKPTAGHQPKDGARPAGPGRSLCFAGGGLIAWETGLIGAGRAQAAEHCRAALQESERRRGPGVSFRRPDRGGPLGAVAQCGADGAGLRFVAIRSGTNGWTRCPSRASSALPTYSKARCSARAMSCGSRPTSPTGRPGSANGRKPSIIR